MQRAPQQQKVSTRIDIKGSRFNDNMWIFTDANCTRNFDNGFDGTKFLGTSLAPQLWAMETSGDYQIDAIPNINETKLGFIAGEDTQYTMTFNHTNTADTYPQMYLIDLLDNNRTIDISESGSQYSFNTISGDVNRFKIVTSLGTITDEKTTSNDYKSIQVYAKNKTIIVSNLSHESGKLSVFDLLGKQVYENAINPIGETRFNTSLIDGAYIVKVETKSSREKTVLILK